MTENWVWSKFYFYNCIGLHRNAELTNMINTILKTYVHVGLLSSRQTTYKFERSQQ